MKRIAWTGQAKTDVRSLDKRTAMRILHALHRFAESGVGDIRALQDEAEELRLRIGDYRLFFVYTGEKTIEIRRVRADAPERQKNTTTDTSENAGALPTGVRPPERYADLARLVEVFDATLDAAVAHMAALFGKKPPLIKKRDREQIRHALRRFLRASKPYVLALGALSGNLDPHRARYALLEGLLKEQLRARRCRVREDEESFAVLLRLAERQAAPPRAAWTKHPCYHVAHEALWRFVLHLQQKLGPVHLQELLEEWVGSPEAVQYVHLVRRLPTSLRRTREQPPKRLTDKLVVQLRDEYRTASASFEQRLRLLVHLSAAGHGQRRSWAEWRSRGLKRLIDTASSYSDLAPVVSAIDRGVRNVLAHGEPIVEANTGMCRFVDGERETAWAFQEFFEKARCLTLTVLALMKFESLLQLAQAQALAQTLWASVASRGGVSRLPAG